MITIHKQILGSPSFSPIEIGMPLNAQVLSVGLQQNQVVIWYRCDPDQQQIVRKFYVIGTGWTVNSLENSTFIGTVLMASGSLIWHVFEVGQ